MRNRAVPPLIGQLIRQGIHDERVLAAMANVPREAFVDEAFAHQAWENMALPIGFGQTISQPYIVARMTEQLLIGKPNSVLEIGTGSGYQTAVLAQLVNHVYSVERIKTLQYQAKRRLQRLDLHNVSTRHGDGWAGWPTKAPFDAILVTAAAQVVPDALVQQLKVGVDTLPLGGEHLVGGDRDGLDLLASTGVLADLVLGQGGALNELIAPLP